MMEAKEKKDSTVDRVEAICTRNFTICNCPEEVFQRFTKFSKKEAADYYAMGLKILLDKAETQAKDLVLFDRLLQIEDRLNEIDKQNKR